MVFPFPHSENDSAYTQTVEEGETHTGQLHEERRQSAERPISNLEPQFFYQLSDGVTSHLSTVHSSFGPTVLIFRRFLSGKGAEFFSNRFLHLLAKFRDQLLLPVGEAWYLVDSACVPAIRLVWGPLKER